MSTKSVAPEQETLPLHWQLGDISHRVGAAAYVVGKLHDGISAGDDDDPGAAVALYTLEHALKELEARLLALSESVQKGGAA
jgi:hypothetical protein